METYYRREQEDSLVDIIDYVRDALPSEQWRATPILRDYASISLESPLWVRFKDKKFLELPVGPLMLSETLFLAQKKGWDIAGKAEKDSRYLQSTQANHDTILQKHREKLKEMATMFESVLNPKSARWKQDFNKKELNIFVSAFKLVRNEEEAYTSWLNEAYTLPSEQVQTSLWENLVLARIDNKESLEINHALFYNPGLDLDIRQRIKVKRFWE